MINRFVCVMLLCSVSMTCAAKDEVQTGETLFNEYGRGACVTCHGKAGNTPKMPLIPKVGGQSAHYIDSQLRDYKYKKRVNGLYIPMQNVMETYSDAEILAIAEYLQSLSGC